MLAVLVDTSSNHKPEPPTHEGHRGRDPNRACIRQGQGLPKQGKRPHLG